MENNKKKILDEINNLYGDTSLSDSELELIEKVSENDEFTNEAIELMKIIYQEMKHVNLRKI